MTVSVTGKSTFNNTEKFTGRAKHPAAHNEHNDRRLNGGNRLHVVLHQLPPRRVRRASLLYSLYLLFAPLPIPSAGRKDKSVALMQSFSLSTPTIHLIYMIGIIDLVTT